MPRLEVVGGPLYSVRVLSPREAAGLGAPRGFPLVLAAALALGAVACSSTPSATLRVDVRTDFVPEVEFQRVTVLVEEEGLSEVYEARSADDFVTGIRVATLDDVARGSKTVRAQLVGADGRSFVTRRVSVELSSSNTVTVVFTRSCVGVSCPAADPLATECVGGRCVSPACSPENPSACGEVGCEVDDDCDLARVDCARDVCSAGECLVGAEAGACGAADYCDPDQGCRPRSGAPLDGGADAGLDGGVPVAGPPANALASVTAIAAGGSHVCAQVGSELLCWGRNDSGQLGDGTTAQRNAPAAVVSGVSGQPVAGRDFSCSVGSSTLECWGANGSGQLGPDGGSGSATPVTVLDDQFLVGVGDAHGCAAERNLCTGPGGCFEDIFCWGANAEGQLGDGTRTSRPSPLSTGTSDDIFAVVAGASHSCYLGFSGFHCWGANDQGQLGLGDTTPRLTPTEVVGGFLLGITTVAAGANHTCWSRNDQLSCWGSNSHGQLGDGTRTQRSSPTASSLTGGVTSLGLGRAHSCAVTEDDRLFCWGANAQGQLGLGDTDDRTTPTEVTLDPSDGTIVAAEVVAGDEFSCALTTTAHVLCWGAGTTGALGDGSATSSLSPVYVIDGRLPAP